MGKFLAGVVVGLISFEVAMWYGFGKNIIPNHLPDNPLLPDKSDCNCQVVVPQNSKVNGTALNRRSTGIGGTVLNRRSNAVV